MSSPVQVHLEDLERPSRDSIQTSLWRLWRLWKICSSIISLPVYIHFDESSKTHPQPILRLPLLSHSSNLLLSSPILTLTIHHLLYICYLRSPIHHRCPPCLHHLRFLLCTSSDIPDTSPSSSSTSLCTLRSLSSSLLVSWCISSLLYRVFQICRWAFADFRSFCN